MPAIDIFSNKAFDLVSLSAAINKAPHKPRLLGSLGLFKTVPIRTTTAAIEERLGTLSVIATAARGAVDNVRSNPIRKIRNFRVPHVPYFQTVHADDIQNIRAFGSETELEAVAEYVNDQLIAMRDDHEATHEYHRIGALKGIVYDSDGSTAIYDYFTEFSISQNTVNFNSTTGRAQDLCSDVIREIGGALGNETFGQIVAICGNDYFDGLIKHHDVKDAFDRWRDGEFRRASMLGPEWYTLATNGFMYQNVMFVNYRGVVGSLTYLAADKAYFFPTDVANMFQEIVAPADFMETVNTRGQLLYAKQEPLAFNKGIQLHTQSNVLYMNARPAAVIESTIS